MADRRAHVLADRFRKTAALNGMISCA